MKKFVLGFITALILVAVVFVIYKFFPGKFSDNGPVAPEELNQEVSDFGMLKVEVRGAGKPLPGVEVDLGKILPNKGPVGPFTADKTNELGVVIFSKVPVGTYDLFWNSYFFPEEYREPFSRLPVEIKKDETTEKKIELIPR